MELFGTVLEFSIWDWLLLVALIYLLYRIVIVPRFQRLRGDDDEVKPIPKLAPMRKKDMTVSELRAFDGVSNADGRILLACNRKIFDVTRGRHHYGPDGPYSALAGHDASRALATMSLDSSGVRDEYDDLSDLGEGDLDQMRDWAESLAQRYPVVGMLLKPDEKSTNDYGDQLAEL